MQYLILGLALLLLVSWGLRAFVNANPKDVVRSFHKLGGVAALLMALFLTATGRFALAIPLILIMVPLMRGGNLSSILGGFSPFFGNANKSAGQKSRVRTRTIEMELDHDSGDMEGRVTRGAFSSRLLSSMDQGELNQLWSDCQASDTQAAQLLEAYLDRRFPDWRADAGPHAKRSGETRGRSEGPMSLDEAYEILGLQAGASKAEVRKAHRRLMKKMHPDQGGSNYLAAKINQAKDLLLG